MIACHISCSFLYSHCTCRLTILYIHRGREFSSITLAFFWSIFIIFVPLKTEISTITYNLLIYWLTDVLNVADTLQAAKVYLIELHYRITDVNSKL